MNKQKDEEKQMSDTREYEKDYSTMVPDFSPFRDFMEIMDAITMVAVAEKDKYREAAKETDSEKKAALKKSAEALAKQRIAIIRRVEARYGDKFCNIEKWLSHKEVTVFNPFTGEEYRGSFFSDRKALYVFLAIEKSLYLDGKMHLSDLNELKKYTGRGGFVYQSFLRIYGDWKAQKNF